MYNEALRPLLVSLEAKGRKFPLGILNEIRSLNDHIARTYVPGETEASRNKHLRLAERHIRRAILDCYKNRCMYEDIAMEKFFESYNNIRLGDVDAGQFYPLLISLDNKAKDDIKKAKMSDGRMDIEETCDLYQKALSSYEETQKFIEESRDKLRWTQDQHKKWSIINILTGVVIGVFCSIIGQCLYVWIFR